MTHLSDNPADNTRWICIYPAYLNCKKTIEEGRKIPKTKGVEHPTVNEIKDVCTSLGFQINVESSKMYPRDQNRDPQYKGRVRVQLKKEDGSPVIDDIHTRKVLIVKIAELIPKLKSRQQGKGAGESHQQGRQDKGKKSGKKGKR